MTAPGSRGRSSGPAVNEGRYGSPTGSPLSQAQLGDGASRQRLYALSPVLTVVGRVILLEPGSLTVGEGAGGAYTVALGQAPTADVTVTIASDNTDVTVDQNTLTFTAGNWNVPQTVTVSAGDDSDNVNRILPPSPTLPAAGATSRSRWASLWWYWMTRRPTTTLTTTV